MLSEKRRTFAKDFGQAGVWLVTSSAIAAGLSAGALIFGSPNGWVGWVIAVLLLIGAFYVAWEREYERRIAAESSLALAEKNVRRRFSEESLQVALGEQLIKAADLRAERIHTAGHFNDWVERFDDWREKTTGILYDYGLPADYALFQNADFSGPENLVAPSTANWEDDVKTYDTMLARHQAALEDILRRRANK